MNKKEFTRGVYVQPRIKTISLQHEFHLLVPSEIKPKPGGPEVHDPDEENDEEIEFE